MSPEDQATVLRYLRGKRSELQASQDPSAALTPPEPHRNDPTDET